MERQKIYHYCYFLLILLLLSCSSWNKTEDDTLSFDKARINTKVNITPGNGWRLNKGTATMDSTNLYNDKATLLISPDSSGESELFFVLNTTEIGMDEVTFSGKYKVISGINEGDIIFTVSYIKVGEIKRDHISITPNDTLWSDFHVKSLLNSGYDHFLFEISTPDSVSFLISDCKVTIDDQPLSQIINKEYGAEKDKKFDNSSRIYLGENLTPQMIENLEVLGKVWGFLKYYHPEVTQGKYNWDYELFRVLPKIANAKDKKERNKRLNKWIDKYGKIKNTKDHTIDDSLQYSRIINLDWINSDDYFDKKLINKLNKIKNADRSDRLNYYVVAYKSYYKPGFEREKKYANIKWEDQGFRMLTLFKLWNVIEYCFPYTDYTDIPWENLLKKFIPDFFTVKSKSDYELTILRLAAHINDSHGNLQFPNKSLSQTIVAPLYTYHKFRLPIELIHSSEGHIAVKSTNSPLFKKGDIICSIDNKSIDSLKAELQPYIFFSNYNGFIRNIMPFFLFSETPYRNIAVLRDGKKIEIKLTHPLEFEENKGYNSGKDLKNKYRDILKDLNIIYINIADSIADIDRIMHNSFKTKGLIIDMRNTAHNNGIFNGIGNYLPLTGNYPLWLSFNEKEYPGRYIYKSERGIEFNDSHKYEGKVIIFVNENVQSALETWAMLYRLSKNSVIIGTQTAGANGNVTSIYLPHNIKFRYTNLGAYYPHWEKLQRVGVKIDIPVYPTIQDIKEGRDVWIEKAIEIIENK